MSVVFRAPDAADLDALRALLVNNGWESRVADPARFRAIVTRADRALVAESDGRLVGFARALCDGVSNGYISMVVVEPSYRGQGIGRALVEGLVGDDPAITWVLRAGRESGGFWRRLGFSESKIAMERTRRG